MTHVLLLLCSIACIPSVLMLCCSLVNMGPYSRRCLMAPGVGLVVAPWIRAIIELLLSYTDTILVFLIQWGNHR